MLLVFVVLAFVFCMLCTLLPLVWHLFCTRIGIAFLLLMCCCLLCCFFDYYCCLFPMFRFFVACFVRVVLSV